MYRSGIEYDKLDKLIYSIYVDYNIQSFPIDEKDLCRKMKIALVPYSAFSDEAKKLLQKKSNHAFFVKESKKIHQQFITTIRLNQKVQFVFLFFMKLGIIFAKMKMILKMI